MKGKIFSFILLTAFLLAVSNILAAASFTTGLNPSSLTQSANSTVLTITNNGDNSTAMSYVIPTTISDGTHTATITQSGSLLSYLSPSNSTTTTLSVSGFSSLYPGSWSSNVNITAFNATSNTNMSALVPITFVKTYCSAGTVGNGTTRYFEITSVRDTSSENDFKWKPADDVSLTVKVRYRNTLDNDDSVDAIIKIELYDTQTHTFVDFDNSDDLERDVSLDEGTTIAEDFTLNVPVDELDDSSGRYLLYVKVYEDGSESRLCADSWESKYNQPIDIQKNSYDVVLKNTESDSTSAPCGNEVTISTTAINTGNNDEDKVYVTAFNKDLSVNLTSSVFALDQGDSRHLDFSFIVPDKAAEKTYTIYLTSHFKYSKSSEEYREDSDPYTVELKVEGCKVDVTSASVTAGFNPETPKAIIGSQLIIDSVIKNTGTTSATFTVDVAGNSAWSRVASIDPKTITLNAGEEKKVSIYLDIDNQAAEGDQKFTIKITSGTYSTEKSVQLALEKGLTSTAIVKHLKDNWYIYAIALVNLILIIAIIVAIVSLSRSRKS